MLINNYLDYFPFKLFVLIIILWIGIFLKSETGFILIVTSSSIILFSFIIYFIALAYDTRRQIVLDDFFRFDQHAVVS